jgi:hypothetical protein
VQVWCHRHRYSLIAALIGVFIIGCRRRRLVDQGDLRVGQGRLDSV